MTEHLEVDGKNFVKASLAADRIGYTSDYVTRLARSKKIDAVQSGRVWYVDLESLKLFSLTAEAEKRERSEQLREERLRERGVLLRELHEANITDRIEASRSSALGQTAVVAASFFVLFNLLWISFEAQLNVRNIAAGFSALASDVHTSTVAPISDSLSQFASFAFIEHRNPVAANESPDQVTPESTTDSADPDFQGVVIFEEAEADQERLDAVRSSFSDEVNVEFDGDDTGVVTPVFRERSGDSYRFLLVPVRPPGG